MQSKNNLHFTYCDEDTAIHVVKVQPEGEKQVPFNTKQSHLCLASLLPKMNKDISLGNYINLINVLTLLGNFYRSSTSRRTPCCNWLF